MTVPITPETKVGTLLEAYPELEQRLIALAPAFAKLQNPILRRTVAKVATLAQAARVAGLQPRTLVAALREAAGQQSLPEDPGDPLRPSPADTWMQSLRRVATVDAESLLEQGMHPLQAVNERLSSLGEDEALVVVSSFVPAPLIDAVSARGFACVSRSVDGKTETVIARRRGPTPDP